MPDADGGPFLSRASVKWLMLQRCRLASCGAAGSHADPHDSHAVQVGTELQNCDRVMTASIRQRDSEAGTLLGTFSAAATLPRGHLQHHHRPTTKLPRSDTPRAPRRAAERATWALRQYPYRNPACATECTERQRRSSLRNRIDRMLLCEQHGQIAGAAYCSRKQIAGHI
jgi:hypothetical protein